jgi:coatomer protein complex subunit alpha (xenin)
MTIHQNRLFYVKDKVIKVFDMDSGIDSPLLTFRRGTLGQVPPPKYLSYNPSENTLLMTSDHEGGIYETYPLPSDISGGPYEATFDLRRGPGKNALYIARNKFAVFEKGANVKYFRMY